MKKLSAVIPTLLKDISILNRLLENLVNDVSVSEIIIINNSTKIYNYDSEKVKIISTGTNLYVNPSWNLGVKEANSEYIALINDDIIIPENFCSAILEKIDNRHGIIGMNGNDVINIQEKNDTNDMQLTTPILSDNITFKQVKYRPFCFGIIMFFKKSVYKPIPDELKIFFGDDYIIHYANKQKKICAMICGQPVIHCGSLSSKVFSDVGKIENKSFKKLIFPWYKRILNFYERDTHYAFYFMFINFSIKKR